MINLRVTYGRLADKHWILRHTEGHPNAITCLSWWFVLQKRMNRWAPRQVNSQLLILVLMVDRNVASNPLGCECTNHMKEYQEEMVSNIFLGGDLVAFPKGKEIKNQNQEYIYIYSFFLSFTQPLLGSLLLLVYLLSWVLIVKGQRNHSRHVEVPHHNLGAVSRNTLQLSLIF